MCRVRKRLEGGTGGSRETSEEVAQPSGSDGGVGERQMTQCVSSWVGEFGSMGTGNFGVGVGGCAGVCYLCSLEPRGSLLGGGIKCHGLGPCPALVSVLGPGFHRRSAKRALPLEQSPMLQMGRPRPEDKMSCPGWVPWVSVQSWVGAQAAWCPVGLVSWPVAVPLPLPSPALRGCCLYSLVT